MKKLILSAVMMMAFVGHSMANTEKDDKETDQPMLTIDTDSCQDQAINEVNVAEAAYHEATSVGGQTGKCFDSWVYNYIYLNALADCLG